MNTVVINGVTISGGKNIAIHNGRITVDGKDVTPDAKEISITINGNVERVEADACERISVKGDVGSVNTASGNVDVVGNVGGSVQTMAGNISCQDVTGPISTMSGNISHRK